MVIKKDQKQENSTDEISLKEIILKTKEWFRFILSKWLILVIIGLLGSVMGYIYASSKKIIYVASTTFVLEEAGGSPAGLGQYSGLASMVGIDLGNNGSIFQGDNLLELYRSRTTLQKTLLSEVLINGKKQLLIDRYIDFNKLREGLSKKLGKQSLSFAKGPGQSFTRIQDSLIGDFTSNIRKSYLTVSRPDKKLNIIKVEVRATDELFAKTFNDQLVKIVNDFYVQTKTKKSAQNVAILKRQSDSVKLVLSGAIVSAVSTLDETPNINPTRMVLRSGAQKSQFNAEMNKAILTELVKNLELSRITLRRETPLIETIDTPVLPLEKVQVSKKVMVVLWGIICGLIGVFFFTVRRFLTKLYFE